MGILDIFKEVVSGGESSSTAGAVDGPNKRNGGHDHRYNTGEDRTPSQKKGDSSRKRDS